MNRQHKETKATKDRAAGKQSSLARNVKVTTARKPFKEVVEEGREKHGPTNNWK